MSLGQERGLEYAKTSTMKMEPRCYSELLTCTMVYSLDAAYFEMKYASNSCGSYEMFL